MVNNRSRFARTAASLAAALFMVVSAVLAQALGPSMEMSWTTVDGGGGVSTFGTLELSGTIGQADASLVMSNGTLEFTGGFWHGVANDCIGDITGDGLVNVPDLLAVINQWGPCPTPPTPCTGDVAPLGGNGVVDVNDLLTVTDGWGLCRY